MKPKPVWPRPAQLYTRYTPLPSIHHASTSSTAHHVVVPPSAPKPAPMAVLPTKTLIRSLLFTSIMASPLLKPCLSVMKYVVESNAPLLKPSRNVILNYILRTTIYNHFCAGVNEREVRRTVQDMKSLGFKGVILGYARESIARLDDNPHTTPVQKQEAVAARAGTTSTSSMPLPPLSIYTSTHVFRFTGAGPLAVDALTRGDPTPPPAIQQAINEICQAAAAQNSRLWIDAEQQVFQDTIDAWTIDLMRRFNRHGQLVVYNTIQAYLKASTENVQRHLTLAATEGWALGIKLVRGAYIAHDVRARIHACKADTDANYDHIVRSLLSREFPLPSRTTTTALPFPEVRLFVASHNAESVRKAYALSRERLQHGLPTVPVELGQLQGMADENAFILAGLQNVQHILLAVPFERLVVYDGLGDDFFDGGDVGLSDLTDEQGLDEAVCVARPAVGCGFLEGGMLAVYLKNKVFGWRVEMQRPVLEVSIAGMIESYCKMGTHLEYREKWMVEGRDG
ncbi:FAD-linked oxidoreductase-like protein [Aspergillus floccosus]